MRHGLAPRPHAWPHSTFHRWVDRGLYPADWRCACDGRAPDPPRLEGFDDAE